ncbi:transcription factor ABORTED MICROSPORES [Impatiens glandulifera]|uniref:transcription factor ABORTED MICROSPORES n=1 Tax=Impatiens glandulifera TaxID=253017 RepID=UPI001FB06C23|nr:transcription factor ABORTED MICROSPORES [Impatiens glandulifera]
MEVAMQNLVESIRPMVDVDGWDYCVIWKLGEDQRFLEWMGCCCGGSRSCIQNVGEELVFPLAPLPPTSCRDAMLLHLRTNSCDLLSQLPTSKPLDSGVYTQTLMSNQPAWLNMNFSNNDVQGTRVLVPVPIGIIELFTTKNVQENQQVVDFVVTQFQTSLEQHMMMNSNNANLNDFNATIENLSLPHDITAERIKLTDSPANYFQQFNYSIEGGNTNGGFIEGSSDSFLNPVKSALEGQGEMDGLQRTRTNNIGGDKDYLNRQGTGRSESNSDCSDQNEEEDDTRPMKRGGKGQAKNLVAERKRRKKLNERLYALRALVPRISKLDRASILGDAIEFVKELKDQVEDLQHELEEGHSDDDTNKSTVIMNNNNVPNFKLRGVQTGETSLGVESSDTNNNEKLRQMEPQVEVVQLYGNEFYIKIFCEHKTGGFVRLMEALDSLGLEVTNVNITSFRSLVSNVFKVERRDNETIHVDHVRESLLEITRNPCGAGWQEMMMTKTHENGGDESNCYIHRHEHNNNNTNQSQYHGNSRIQHCHPFNNLQNN